VTAETPAVTTIEHSGPVTESGRAVTSGQNIDTSSILGTDFTQVAFNALHADEGVDPVAEAEVYLAYGRDPQAEEILLDALKQNPRRAAIYLKLLEVYAKRGDRAKFDQYLRTLSELTGEQGPDWTMALAIGQRAWPQDERFATVVVTDTLEPTESLAEKAGESTLQREISPASATAPAAEAPAQPAATAEPAATVPQADFVELDFDLDKLTEQMAAEPKPAPATAAPAPAPDALDFDLELPPEEESSAAGALGGSGGRGSFPGKGEDSSALEFPELSLEENAAAPREERPAPSPAEMAESQELKSMLEEIDFDLAEISPETEAPGKEPTEPPKGAEPSAVAPASAEEQKSSEAGPPTEVMDIDLERFAGEAGTADHDTRLQLAQAYLEMGIPKERVSCSRKCCVTATRHSALRRSSSWTGSWGVKLDGTSPPAGWQARCAGHCSSEYAGQGFRRLADGRQEGARCRRCWRRRSRYSPRSRCACIAPDARMAECMRSPRWCISTRRPNDRLTPGCGA